MNSHCNIWINLNTFIIILLLLTKYQITYQLQSKNMLTRQLYKLEGDGDCLLPTYTAVCISAFISKLVKIFRDL